MIDKYIIKFSLTTEPFERLSLNTVFEFVDESKLGLWIKTHANSAAKVNGNGLTRVEIKTEVRAGILLTEEEE